MLSLDTISVTDSVTNSSSPARWPLTLAAMTALLGVVLSVTLASRIQQAEERVAIEQFRIEAETLQANLERELQLYIEVLNSIRALHGLSGEVSGEALAEFVDKGMQHQQSILGAFGFAQRIGHGMRLSIEQAFDESADMGYRLVEQGADGGWISAGARAIYYPLTWESHTAALRVPIGFDFLSRTDARQAVEYIQQHGRPAIVRNPVAYEQQHAEHATHWVFTPIFVEVSDSGGQVASALIGFAVGLLDPGAMLERVLALSVPSPGVQVSLASARPQEEFSGDDMMILPDGQWLFQRAVEVINQEWWLSSRRDALPRSAYAITVLVAGLLVSLVLTSQLIVLAGRTRRIEQEVQARTSDLQHATAELERQMQERVRLEEEMSDLATRERQRLGRDLHDSLGQKLTGAVFLSRSLLSHFKATAKEEEAHARTLNETLKEAVGQVRAMARGLAPVALNDESLVGALSQLAEEMTSLYGVSCEWVESDASPELDGKSKEQLYLIAREAVNNAARHAKPGRVLITLGTDSAGGFILKVEDDGVGLDEAAISGTGMGLRIMRYRARMIRAELEITPRPEGGTCVVCSSRPPAS